MNFKMCGGLFSFCFPYETVFGNGQVAITHNGLRLCVRLRSVGIERSGSLHKTAVISWLRLVDTKLKLEHETFFN